MLHLLELHKLPLYLSPPRALHGAELLVTRGRAEVRALQTLDVLQDLDKGRSLCVVTPPAC